MKYKNVQRNKERLYNRALLFSQGAARNKKKLFSISSNFAELHDLLVVQVVSWINAFLQKKQRFHTVS